MYRGTVRGDVCRARTPADRLEEGGYNVKRTLRVLLSLSAVLLILFGIAAPAHALDDTYRFDSFGMSLKISKSYYVITRDTPESDSVFTTLNLDYRQTMSLFEEADIYLRAYEPYGTFQISLTVTSDENSKTVNNYAELTEAERRGILDALLTESAVTSATEVKRGSYIFFDTSRSVTLDGAEMYVSQCNTVVNGWQVDLSLQKSRDGILPSEAKILSTIASSIEFESVKKASSGPVFDWWRLLLWGVLLAGLSVSLSFIYKHQNNVKRRRLEERRRKRAEGISRTDAPDEPQPDEPQPEEPPVTFEETLGYQEADRFSARAAADLDTYDISVREKNPARGINYFEDEGKSIDDRAGDYFETYFTEPTPTRSGIARLCSTIGANLAIWFRHLGYFFRNLWNKLTGKKKKQS